MKHVTQQKLKDLFDYKQGKLIWKFDMSRKVKAGDIAGNVGPSGYRRIEINGKGYTAHRLIFLMHNGYLPKYIDHKYGKKIGDYLWNLRECTGSQNQYNSKIRKNHPTGVKGVSYSENYGKRWCAQVIHEGELVINKRFNTIKEAENAAIETRNKYHGEFANHGR